MRAWAPTLPRRSRGSGIASRQDIACSLLHLLCSDARSACILQGICLRMAPAQCMCAYIRTNAAHELADHLGPFAVKAVCTVSALQ